MNSGSNLFIVGFEGTKLTDELKTKLLSLNPAGIIFYDTNIQNKEQCRDLITELKALLGVDLIVCTDQEGGKVERLRLINSSLPSLAALGRSKSDEAIIAHSNLLASEIYDLGFNLVLAPCADLQINPLNPIIGTRSLGSDPQIVSKQIQLIIQTYHANGIKTCVKHFPGHGSSNLDSHLDLPIIQSQDIEIEVFNACIKSRVDSIMVAHLIVEDWDLELPASLSSKCISKINFDGLIISDEITMKALSQFGNYNELASKLILAGNDLVIWNTNIDEALEAKYFLDKSNSLELQDRIKKSLEKIQKFNSKQYLIQEPTKMSVQMIDICKNSIIKKTNKKFKIEKNTALLIYKHPKLESEKIHQIFNLPFYNFPNENLDEIISKHQSLIIISFQADIREEEKNLIKELYQKYPELEILHCSTDIETHNADIELLGTSSVHFKALLSMLLDH